MLGPAVRVSGGFLVARVRRGMALLVRRGLVVAAVMAAADAACYAVKRSGRNGVRVHGQADLRLVGE